MDWLKTIANSQHRRQLLVGRAKKLHDEGKKALEIAEILNIPESTARNLTEMFTTLDRVNAKKNEDIPNN